LNFGALQAGMKISRPVCGFRPFRAECDITEKVPNPTSVTLSPLLSDTCTLSTSASNAFSAWRLVISASFAILATRSALFIATSLLRRAIEKGTVHNTGPAYGFSSFTRASSQKRLRLYPVQPMVVVQILGGIPNPDRPRLQTEHGPGRSAATGGMA